MQPPFRSLRRKRRHAIQVARGVGLALLLAGCREFKVDPLDPDPSRAGVDRGAAYARSTVLQADLAARENKRAEALRFLDTAIFVDPTVAEPYRKRAELRGALLPAIYDEAGVSDWELKARRLWLELDGIIRDYRSFLRLSKSPHPEVRAKMERQVRLRDALSRALEGDKGAIVPADWAEVGVIPRGSRQRELEELFPGDSVDLPPPVAMLSIGMPFANAERALPGIGGMMRLEEYGLPGGWIRANKQVRGGVEVVESICIELPFRDSKVEIEKALIQRWGRPAWRRSGKMWFNAARGLSAVWRGSNSLCIHRHTPFRDLLGTERTRFGFEAEPLLGLDVEGLIGGHGEKLAPFPSGTTDAERAAVSAALGGGAALLGEDRSTTIELPHTEYSNQKTTVYPQFEPASGRIVSVTLAIGFDAGSDAERRMLAEMTAAWGEPTEEEVGGEKQFVFSEDPFLRASIVRGSDGNGIFRIERSLERPPPAVPASSP